MYTRPKPPYIPPVTIDDTFSCTADIVKELERMRRPKMARWVASLDKLTTEANRNARNMYEQLAELQRQLPQFQREKPFDPRPPAEASD